MIFLQVYMILLMEEKSCSLKTRLPYLRRHHTNVIQVFRLVQGEFLHHNGELRSEIYREDIIKVHIFKEEMNLPDG